MLFDESTSALDESTEEGVVQRLVQYCAGRTLIFITHRPAVLRYCTHQVHLARPDGAMSNRGASTTPIRRRFTGEML